MSGRDVLSAFLTEQASRGGEDCHVIVLRWYEAVTGRDCSGLLPERHALHVAGIYRGMLRVCRCLKLPETAIARRGDVGLFRHGDMMMAGICTGGGWAARTAHGIGVYRTALKFRAWVPE